MLYTKAAEAEKNKESTPAKDQSKTSQCAVFGFFERFVHSLDSLSQCYSYSIDYLDYDFVVLPSMGYANNKRPQTDVKDPIKLDLPVI